MTASVSFAQEQETFRAPKSDAGLEFLLDVLNVPLEKLAQAQVVSDEVVQNSPAFIQHVITLKNEKAGQVRLFLRVPNKQGSFPTLFFSPGLHSDPGYLAQLKIPEDVVIAQIEFPFNDRLKGPKLVYEIIRRSLKIQALTTVAMNWVRTQNFVNPEKISVVSVSFGTFVTPFSLRLAQLLGLDPYAVVFAYGGSDLKSVLNPLFKDSVSVPDFDNIQKALTPVLKATSPARHLRFLQSQAGYLVITAKSDQVIPKESSQTLITQLPDPVEVIELDGGHLSPEHPEQIGKAITVTTDWLRAQGAFEE